MLANCWHGFLLLIRWVYNKISTLELTKPFHSFVLSKRVSVNELIKFNLLCIVHLYALRTSLYTFSTEYNYARTD